MTYHSNQRLRFVTSWSDVVFPNVSEVLLNRRWDKSAKGKEVRT